MTKECIPQYLKFVWITAVHDFSRVLVTYCTIITNIVKHKQAYR